MHTAKQESHINDSQDGKNCWLLVFRVCQERCRILDVQRKIWTDIQMVSLLWKKIKYFKIQPRCFLIKIIS